MPFIRLFVGGSESRSSELLLSTMVLSPSLEAPTSGGSSSVVTLNFDDAWAAFGVEVYFNSYAGVLAARVVAGVSAGGVVAGGVAAVVDPF